MQTNIVISRAFLPNKRDGRAARVTAACASAPVRGLLSFAGWMSVNLRNFCWSDRVLQNFLLCARLPGFCVGWAVVCEPCLGHGSPEIRSPLDLLLGIESCSCAGQVPAPAACTLEAQETPRRGCGPEPESRSCGLRSVSEGLRARGTGGVDHSPRQEKTDAPV